MNQSAEFAAVAGYFSPLLIATIVQSKWSSGTKRWTAFAVYVAVGIGASFCAGTLLLDKAHLFGTGLAILAAAVAGESAHGGLLNGVSEKVETATNRA